MTTMQFREHGIRLSLCRMQVVLDPLMQGHAEYFTGIYFAVHLLPHAGGPASEKILTSHPEGVAVGVLLL